MDSALRDDALMLIERVADLAREVARPAAADVDAGARFPSETLAALKQCGALGAGVPAQLGGGGQTIAELCAMCTALGQHCASSAMVLAMHHIQVLALVNHRAGRPELDDYLRRLCKEQRLIASVTSEVGPGGDMRHSVAAVEMTGDRFTLRKLATTVSYGQQADDLLISARRSADAAPSDQVLVLSLGGQHHLSDIGQWNTLGMRGTCSPPATVTTEGNAWQILQVAFGEIANETMVPSSHILWAACWLGIASDAVNVARGMVRKKARTQPGVTPPVAQHLAQTVAKLHLLRDELAAVRQEYERLLGSDRAALSSFAFSLRINNLKLSASRLVVEIVAEALNLTGIAAYSNGTPLSLGRHLRDAHSAPLMINNLRILETNASLLLVAKQEIG